MVINSTTPTTRTQELPFSSCGPAKQERGACGWGVPQTDSPMQILLENLSITIVSVKDKHMRRNIFIQLNNLYISSAGF